MSTARDLVQIARCRELVASGEARRLRRAARLSLAEMADVIGVNPSAVSHYEAGRRTPRTDVARRYAAVLDRLAAMQTEVPA